MRRLLNLSLFTTFQFCYLEWPPNNSMYIFQGELEIIAKTDKLINNLTHPVILLGLIAQIILLIGVLFPKLNKKVNTFGASLLLLLVLLFLIVGLISKNFKIAISTLPYLITSIGYVFYLYKQKVD